MPAARTALALLLLVLGLLAVFRAPHYQLWKPAVGATAFGAFLLPLAALVTWTGRGEPSSWIALAASVLLASPLLRAIPVAGTVADDVRRVFGDEPWRHPAAPPRDAPYTLLGLLGPGTSGPAPETREFAPGLALDLYRGAGPGPHPVVVGIHGGSWNSGEPSQLSAIYRYLAARGITVAAPTYRFAPQHPFPAAHDDVLTAIRWLRDHATELDTDPERTVLLGRSAGGHLALLAAYRSDDPGIRGVIALYPPADLHWSWDNPSNPWVLDSPKTLSEFLGGTPQTAGAAFDAATPIAFVGPNTPPTLLLHGTRDELVFAEQSRRLAAKLRDQGVPHVLIETPWDTHGFDANLGGPGGQLYVWAVERFLGSVFSGPT